MKHVLEYIPDWILDALTNALGLLLVSLFFITWPIGILYTILSVPFSRKLDDSQKVDILQEAIAMLVMLVLFSGIAISFWLLSGSF